MKNSTKNDFEFLRIAIEKGEKDAALNYMNKIRRQYDQLDSLVRFTAKNMLKVVDE